jgi:predicted  nucleic acid-binding Zn-ribbon protein
MQKGSPNYYKSENLKLNKEIHHLQSTKKKLSNKIEDIEREIKLKQELFKKNMFQFSLGIAQEEKEIISI